jgi:hypothetical protein
MQTQQTITLFGTVSNSASSRITKNGRKYTAFGVSIISDRNLQAFSYNVVAWGKEGHFAKSLLVGTRIKLVVQAQSQPDNIASIPLLTATFVRPVRPVALGIVADSPSSLWSMIRRLATTRVRLHGFTASCGTLSPTITDAPPFATRVMLNTQPKLRSPTSMNSHKQPAPASAMSSET